MTVEMYSVKIDMEFDIEAEDGIEAVQKAQEIIGEIQPSRVKYFCVRGE